MADMGGKSDMGGNADMGGKTVVVTGGNSGIGLETAVALGQMGARVLITARNAARGEAAVRQIAERIGTAGSVELVLFDLADLASVRAGADEILDRCPQLHVLVNNAGLVLSERTETVDGYESTFAINHLGPFLLTTRLLPRLVESAPARIVNVASSAHMQARHGMPFDDLQSTRAYAGMRVYGTSKLANILFTNELARRLAGQGVTANSLAPRHGVDRLRRGRRRQGLPRHRHQDRQAVLPLSAKGCAHVDLPGLVA